MLLNNIILLPNCATPLPRQTDRRPGEEDAMHQPTTPHSGPVPSPHPPPPLPTLLHLSLSLSSLLSLPRLPSFLPSLRPSFPLRSLSACLPVYSTNPPVSSRLLSLVGPRRLKRLKTDSDMRRLYNIIPTTRRNSTSDSDSDAPPSLTFDNNWNQSSIAASGAPRHQARPRPSPARPAPAGTSHWRRTRSAFTVPVLFSCVSRRRGWWGSHRR